MKILIALIALIAFTGCAGTFGATAPERPRTSWFEPRDTALETAWVATSALTACDSAGTIWSTNFGAYNRVTSPGMVLGERNPMVTALLGDHPGPAAFVVSGLVTIGASYAVTRAPLPRWVRWTLLGGLGAVESFAVAANARYAGACGLAGVTDMPLSMPGAR